MSNESWENGAAGGEFARHQRYRLGRRQRAVDHAARGAAEHKVLNTWAVARSALALRPSTAVHRPSLPMPATTTTPAVD